MTELEAKNILSKRIKYGLLANNRNANEEKVRDICISWWHKVGKYASRTAECWEACFDRAEQRKQGIITLFDFLGELEHWIPERPDDPNSRYNDIPSCSTSWSKFINKLTKAQLSNLPNPVMQEQLQFEYKMVLASGVLDPAQKSWWLGNYPITI